MTPNSSATSSWSRLEVGSSRIRILTSVETARAIATSCCTASEWLLSSESGSSSRPTCRIASRAAARIARQSMKPSLRGSRPSMMFSATDRLGSRSIS